MKSIIFIATVLVGIAIANNCEDPLVADLITDASMNEILHCAQPNTKCTIPLVYLCMRFNSNKYRCMKVSNFM